MLPDFGSDTFLKQMKQLRGKGVFNSYMMAVTALQQGMTVQFYRSQAEAGTDIKHFKPETDNLNFYSIMAAGKVLHFSSSQSELEGMQAHAVTQNKSVLKYRLSKNGINVPFGGAATVKDMAVVEKLKAAKVKHVSVKPVTGGGSRGVHLYQSPDQAIAIIKAAPETVFIVEQMVEGAEFRITASQTDIVSAQMIIPPHVVGDGESNLQDLILREGAARARNPCYMMRPLDTAKILQSMQAQKVDADTVLDKGQLFRLTLDNMPNRAFREPVLDRLPKRIKDTAKQTVKIIDGFVCGLDIFVDKAGEPYVLDIDAVSGMWFECFPYPNGEWNLTVPEYILKHHFPRHKRVDRVIKSYDFTALRDELLREGRTSKGVNAADFVEFG